MTPAKPLESLILTIRGRKVVVDADLASVYGVTTKRLNEQVKRNVERFPEDFVFRLTAEEKAEVVAICDHLGRLRFASASPSVFTEHGAIMAASMLNSPQSPLQNSKGPRRVQDRASRGARRPPTLQGRLGTPKQRWIGRSWARPFGSAAARGPLRRCGPVPDQWRSKTRAAPCMEPLGAALATPWSSETGSRSAASRTPPRTKNAYEAALASNP